MGAIFRACAIHGFCFSLDFVNARLWSKSHVNNYVYIFFPFNNNAVFVQYLLTEYYRTWKLACNLLSNTCFSPPYLPLHLPSQVMETKNMLYLVTEYAKNGEIFGESFCCVFKAPSHSDHPCTSRTNWISRFEWGMFLANKEVSKS